MSHVLDASALLTLLQKEPGWDRVAETVSQSCISAVNLSEVATKLIERGAAPANVASVLDAMGFEVLDFDHALGLESATLRPSTARHGLSLGDRACLATARLAGKPVLTADRVWAQLDLGVTIDVIR